ncbi:hypothetical protein DI270_013410 [Microbispora triticiradicis]|uniref:Uncharacterized protein n=1 Tax=Microbispora triticiradicis TaxID=2200763 RepID=A0ABX9LKL1_9ACTN|nr:hypothetical protein [Microbispora triticiradicis]RGA04485.1 hypothetical protein DI270_013410 [Microbispora triticiradicis]
MWAGIAALAIAGLMIRAKKWDKVVVALLVLGAGLVAKYGANPVTGWANDFVKAVAIIGLAAIVIDYLTKKIERITYVLAVAVPFFCLAAPGAIGRVANELFSSDLVSLFNQM